MFAHAPVLKKSFCLTVAVILLWLGGLGCALCCATMVTEACCAEENSATLMILSPDESEHGCCQTSQSIGNSSNDSAISKTASLKGCSLLPRPETSLAVLPHIAGDEAIAPTRGDPLMFGDFAINIKIAAIHPSLPGRNDTYLRCCVLLI